MRQLHVVAVSEDGRHVLLAGKKGAAIGGFRVALDDRLLAAVRGDLPRPGEDPHAAPELSPKEIQARLRAGESAESIAASAGVPVTRVERFSGPVQGEMARMIDATRSAYVVRGRLGRSAEPLGVAVDAALAASPSLRPESVDWETHREEDGRWLVTVSWFARARSRTASWYYDPAAKAVTAADPASAALAHVAAGSPAPAPRSAASAGTATAPAGAPARKAPAKAAKKAPKKAAKATAKKATKKAAPVKAAAKKATTKAAKATARKAAPARKPAAAKAPAKKAKQASRTTARGTGGRSGPVLRVVPDPEPRTRRPAKAADARDGVKTRVSVPGWADVLLGATPGSTPRTPRTPR